MMSRRYRPKLILSLIAFGTILTSPAQATLMVNIGGTVSGGTVVGGTTYTDNQAGVDANPATGVLDIGAFLNTISVNFVINGFATTSGSPIASLSLNTNSNLQPSAVLPLNVSIIMTDTDFSTPSTPLSLAQTVNLLSSVGGLTAFATGVGYYGDSNTPFDVDGPSTAAATSALAGGVNVNNPGVSGIISGPATYSLTSAINIDILARGVDPLQNLQLNGNLSASGATIIPEPASALLFGAGMLGLAALIRRKSLGA